MTGSPDAGARRRGRVPWRTIGAVAVVIGVLAAALTQLPLVRWVQAIVDDMRALGPAGAVAYVLVYAALATVSFPASVLTMGAGFAYGPVGGLLVASPASLLSAALSFWLAERFLRRRVERTIQASRRLRAIERAVSEQGFRVVFLIRLSPVVPFALTNYSLGVTRIRFWRYVGASFLGMLPGAFLYSYLGSTLEVLTHAAAPDAEASTAKSVLFWTGLAATLAVTVLLTRAARRALDEAVDELAEGPGGVAVETERA